MSLTVLIQEKLSLLIVQFCSMYLRIHSASNHLRQGCQNRLRLDRVRDLSSQPTNTPPSLLVIDGDKLSAEIRSGNGWAGVPRVVIGSARLADENADVDGRYLQKPFQYPELIRLIDQLLTDRAA